MLDISGSMSQYTEPVPALSCTAVTDARKRVQSFCSAPGRPTFHDARSSARTRRSALPRSRANVAEWSAHAKRAWSRPLVHAFNQSGRPRRGAHRQGADRSDDTGRAEARPWTNRPGLREFERCTALPQAIWLNPLLRFPGIRGQGKANSHHGLRRTVRRAAADPNLESIAGPGKSTLGERRGAGDPKMWSDRRHDGSPPWARTSIEYLAKPGKGRDLAKWRQRNLLGRSAERLR